MEKIIKIVNLLNLFACCWLLVRVLFWNIDLPYWFEYGGLYLFFTTFVVEILLEKRWRNIHWNKTTLYFCLFFVFFILGVVYAPFDGSEYFRHHMEARYSLLGFSIVGIFGVNKYYKLSYLFNVMIISSFLAIVYLVFFKIGLPEFVTSSERSILFTNARIATVNAHMGFNLYLNLSLVGIWYICTRKWENMSRLLRYSYVFILFVLFFVLSISEGRSGFLASLVIMSTFIIIEAWKHRKVFGLFVALSLPILAFFISTQHARLSEDMIQSEPRLDFWHSAIELISEKPIFGYGMSNAQEAFNSVNMKYTEPAYSEFWKHKNPWYIDTHNQYLQTTLEFGMLGLVLLLVIYFMPIFIVSVEKRILAVFICGLCAYQSMFDMFITGQFCMFFCLLMLFLLRVPDDIGHKKIVST